MNRRLLPAAVAFAVTALPACSGARDPSAEPAPRPTPPPTTATRTTTPEPTVAGTPTETPRTGPVPRRLTVADTVATRLEAPWGLAFLPDGSALVSQRDEGTIVRIDGGRVTEVGEVPGVRPGGEGGLLGLAVSPDFEEDRYVYAYFTAEDDNRIVRMTYGGGRLGEPDVVLDGIEKSAIHNGGRIAFGPDGMLYVGTGDAADPDRSQDRDSPNGKILRLTPDGDPAPGNPFSGSPIWSLGHRNVQGLAWDEQGRLWASEFGQNTYDELNLIEKGRNYGWPVVEGRGDEERFTNPRAVWSPADASPSGVAVAGGAVYMAGLRGERLWQIPTSGGDPRAFLTEEHGRLRTVAVAPDGALWVVTSNTDGRGDVREGDDRVLRIPLGSG